MTNPDSTLDNFTPPILETARTIMRCPQLQDFDARVKMWADPEVIKFISAEPYTPEQSWAGLLSDIGHWYTLGYGGWTIEDKQTGEFLGQVSFGDKKRGIAPGLEEIPEIGWALPPSVHGRGIATETVKAALEWADNNLITPKTYGIFAPEHIVSQYVAQKCGYEDMMTTTYLGQPALIMSRDRPPQADVSPT